MKKVPISISIPENCSESFDNMQAVDGGKYCDSCSKTVHDFTLMSDGALHDFFTKYPGPHCGRLHESQLDRQIISAQPHRSFFKKFTTVAATMLAFIAAKPAAAQNAKPLQRTEQYFPEKRSGDLKSDSKYFKGTIRDVNGKPVGGAEVVLINGVDGYRVYSDSSGKFSIEVTGKLDVAASLSFTYYSFTKSDLITPTYLHSSENINIILSAPNPKVSAKPISCRVGGLAITNIKSENETMISTGAYSVWDTLRKLAH